MRNTALSLVLSTTLAAATASAALADPMDRYFELQEVIEQINDPDPLMRIAMLEQILAEGDATKVQLAIRAALTIDDPNVRSLALRTHFAAYSHFIITADYPEEIKTVMASGDGSGLQELRRTYGNMFQMFDTIGHQFILEAKHAAPGGDHFEVYALNNVNGPSDRAKGEGNIRGALITIQTTAQIFTHPNYYRCKFEFGEYEGLTATGTGSCDMQSSTSFPVTLHLFDPAENGAPQGAPS